MKSVQPKGSHFIDGAYVDDTAGREISCVYAATGETVATLHAATPAIVEAAIASAERAQKEWAALAPVARGRVLRRVADLLVERNAELSELESIDTGKPIQETLVADATSGAEALEYYAGLAATLTGETVPLGGDFVYTIREPLGVCLGIGAWNYPTQIAAWKAAPALACGNAMVFKPSEVTPLCALKLAELFIEAGAPAGLFNVVNGYGDAAASMVTDPRIAKVSLTGSVPTGQKVYAAAAEGLRHVTMELGGKSPLIIFEDADLENAISAAINANFYSTGQICSNGTRVFVHENIVEDFIERLVERSRTAILGDPLDPDTQIGPMITDAQRKKVLDYIRIGQEEGAELILGGHAPEGPGFFIEPTIFRNVTDEMTIAREEIFGPVLSILTFKDEDEVVARANDTQFGLAAGLFTKDFTRAHRVVAQLQAGTCWINEYNLTPVEAPFGGVKMSGVGRENSKAAIEHYSQVKSVYVAMGDVEAAF
ncbi:NAD/NADP-dependent betaine aldehyde dehydrogenase [Pseudooceanicola marinus]|uniref:Betaine-aldehyde dehydrogenase n=1 Tax=Pseudooceanicola marinus TaxID=396013 RepID=A0A1X6Z0K2_9RHOB|nr:betaine-aldehyde dehydrogenase [Pseudooceanicola marinus]PJE32713.1 betaine-aldehyde dehydrogenase [Pseudooceanicola marinus]SLN36420.1 NAD/NADP-dependent betaine aldehyde dehydrogenase [Pseudooceanicola marinus]